VFEGGTALAQLWLFIAAPIVGGVLGALIWTAATGGDEVQTGELEAQSPDPDRA
jgi:aquaporin Z